MKEASWQHENTVRIEVWQILKDVSFSGKSLMSEFTVHYRHNSSSKGATWSPFPTACMST